MNPNRIKRLLWHIRAAIQIARCFLLYTLPLNRISLKVHAHQHEDGTGNYSRLIRITRRETVCKSASLSIIILFIRIFILKECDKDIVSQFFVA